MDATDASVRHELLSASDEVIEDAVNYADPMVLRGLVYLLTGDPEVKATKIKPVTHGPIETNGLASDDEVALLRRKTVDFLKSYRDAGAGPIDIAWDRAPASLDLVTG